MPYNTRRKSLSLSELGVHVPKRARAPSQLSPPSPSKDGAEPPNKKARCVPQFISPPGSMSPPKTTNIRIKTEDVRPISIENTPPPSPGSLERPRISTEGIKDEVVVGAIVQLEKTGNRPHTSKELAAALAHTVPTIDSSTNPNALIQARLATYLKGPWPIVSPCPIGKEQENVHPRRVFYFLTSMPHQPIPDTTLQQPSRRIISPSLSSNTDDEMEEKHQRARTQLSPSPEVDLSSPELEDEQEPEYPSMHSSRSSLSRDPSSTNLMHNQRAASPPLEREERDFKQTANELQQQRRDSQQKSRQSSEAAVKIEDEDGDDVKMNDDTVTEESEESAAMSNQEAAATLFGGHEHLAVQGPNAYDLSSPVIRPQIPTTGIDAKVIASKLTVDSKSVTTTTSELMVMNIDNDDPTSFWAWDDNKSPENVELDELEIMFDAY